MGEITTGLNNTIFVRIAKQSTHDKFLPIAKELTMTHPEKIYFDEIDCVIWQNGHAYGFAKEYRDFIINNKDNIAEIIADYDNVVAKYGSIKDALDKLFEFDPWETYN